jgi:uncharacterized membrane protein
VENKEKPNEQTIDAWHADPKNWRWGLFYYNKDDKRIFPRKRVSVFGWTINFANPWSILSFVVLAALLFGIIAGLSHL